MHTYMKHHTSANLHVYFQVIKNVRFVEFQLCYKVCIIMVSGIHMYSDFSLIRCNYFPKGMVD